METLKNNQTNSEFFFTSESVSLGHPDKLCDQISDAIVDIFLAADPEARVAVETLVAPGNVVLAGEVRGPDTITKGVMEEAVRRCIQKVNYGSPQFHHDSVQVSNFVHSQSPDIAQGVDAGVGKPEGAGDQGIMFGYACDETDALMPATIYYSHRILERLQQGRESGHIQGLGPDAKSQVTLRYRDRKPISAEKIVVSIQHHADLSLEQVQAIVIPEAKAVFPEGWVGAHTEFFINPTGRFIIGGPEGDAGVTGRKIIVDTYACRYLAKNVVKAGLATRCTLQISYAIGVATPLSFYVNTHGTGVVADHILAGALSEAIDLTPAGIKRHLQLKRPIYLRTATFGHFGRTPDADGGFSWEKTDLMEGLIAACKRA
jgi:S-adenosylmethionine synthetase